MAQSAWCEELVEGEVSPGFEKVRDAFLENFALRREVGAACTVYHRGKKVVDLWGGYRDGKRKLPWEEDTIVPVFSTSKGMATMALAAAHSRGWLDFDEKVATYWPDFAQKGKEEITVRQLLNHRAGLCVIDIPLGLKELAQPEVVFDAIAQQEPVWEPGTRHGYHSISLGWYESAILHHVDPQRRTLQQFFLQEIAEPWDLTFFFGVPQDFPQERLATIGAVRLLLMPFHLGKLSWPFVRAFLTPWTISSRSIRNPKGFNDPASINKREILGLNVPAVTGAGLVRSIAKAYGVMASGGDDVIGSSTLQELCQPATFPPAGAFDEVIRCDIAYQLGYMKPFPNYPFSPNPEAFGTPGAGGSIGFADPVAEIGYAYAPNRMDFYIFDDPRERALREAVYACLNS